MKNTNFLKLFLLSTLLLSCSDEVSTTTTSNGGTMETINGVPVNNKAAIEESLQANKAAGKSTMTVVIRNPDGSTKTVELPSPLNMQ